MKTITAITLNEDRIHQRIKVPWPEKGEQPHQEDMTIQIAPAFSPTRIIVEANATTTD